MALFGHVCKHFSSVNGTTFIALIEVLSRKNGKPRFLVYGAFCPLPPLMETDRAPEDDQFIYTECADMKNADLVFDEYRRCVISRFSPAPYGFQRFIDRWRKRRELEIETVFDYFPRWIKEGKKIGRRRGTKTQKPLYAEFGDPRSLLSLRQRALSQRQNFLNAHAGELPPERKDALLKEIAFLEQDVKIIRCELRKHVQS